MNDISRDILQDIIDHTIGLDGIDLLKVTGTDTETLVNASSENRSVILNAKLKNPINGFRGVFGMPNLPKLKTILGFNDEYDEHAKITVVMQNRNGEDHPASIHFENKAGDFVNDYRLMSKTIVEEKVKTVLFKGAAWNVDFEPTIAGVQRLKKQSTVHNEETVFCTKMVKGALNVSFGDPATHSGNFVFHSGLMGNLSKSQEWPVRHFITIMDLLGNKHIYISEQGAMRITVDSGLVDYEYLLPAQSK